MRDAAFSRQRYWGEPLPIVWKNGIAYPLDEKDLPLELPHVDSYKPGPDGEGPLANIPEWVEVKECSCFEGRIARNQYHAWLCGFELVFLRYMDPHNQKEFCDRRVIGLLEPGRSLYRRD